MGKGDRKWPCSDPRGVGGVREPFLQTVQCCMQWTSCLHSGHSPWAQMGWAAVPWGLSMNGDWHMVPSVLFDIPGHPSHETQGKARVPCAQEQVKGKPQPALTCPGTEKHAEGCSFLAVWGELTSWHSQGREPPAEDVKHAGSL